MRNWHNLLVKGFIVECSELDDDEYFYDSDEAFERVNQLKNQYPNANVGLLAVLDVSI